ncbi:MAG: glycosyltransferase family 2 protein, partial [Candidatus Uhrbacteria bacterium]|nr:glycosyltransferase family 2 protein [Candidatus Uhrbacteria bacterium]
RHYLGLPYHDTQCGFKVFRKKTVKPLFERLMSTGWVFDVELIVRARKAGLKIKEIPVIWYHGRETRVRWKDFWKIVKEIHKIKHID